jgi:putative flippase GtrA
MEKPAIILPVRKNEKPFDEFIKDIAGSFSDYYVVIVNDGCYSDVELPVEYKGKIDVIHHATSLGLGRAIKSGINQYLVNKKHLQKSVIVVNRDDGFVFREDVEKISEYIERNPNDLIWGYSEINEKSKFIVNTAVRLFGLLSGLKISNLMSTIFAIPYPLLLPTLHLNDSGDDISLDILSLVGKWHYQIMEVVISQDNQQSGYSTRRIIKDSLKLFFIFLRFSFISIITAGIDMAVFSLLFFLTNNILLSIVISRITAGTFQFVSGKHLVFRSRNNYRKELIKYILLVAILMMLSYSVLTPMVIYLRLSPYLAKVITEAVIFFLSFAAQKMFVFSSEDHGESTDWDQYYKTAPKTTVVTRKFTERILINLMEKYRPENIKQICEFGGGNSTFFPIVRASFPNTMYAVVDNNQLGLNLFLENNQDDPFIQGFVDDILSPTNRIPTADIVYSVGLIEHFSPEDTKRAIKEHFNVCRPGGIVILTFPTPTWLYQAARSIADFLGLWHFHDERPLSFKEVIEIAKEFGEVKESLINWPIVFTQGVILVEANEAITNKVEGEF